MAIELTTATAEQISGIQDALNLDIPVLTEYPTTDASKVGQKFIYRGNEWKYHSQAELDDLGWVEVSEGFPAPVNKSVDLQNLIYNSDVSQTNRVYYLSTLLSAEQYYNISAAKGGDLELDFVFFGNQLKRVGGLHLRFSTAGSLLSTIISIKNAQLLINLEDSGTASAIKFTKSTSIDFNMSASVLNDFFTQLPTTTKTVTIDIFNATGSATCDPTIATAKGYTVVT